MLFHKSRLKIEGKYQHILFWGGLRGALALALALGLPPEIEHREQIITATFGVAAFSIFVQGLTMTPLLKWLQVVPRTSVKNINSQEQADRSQQPLS
jgi:CPA1 family monovalent cation:H+ antiporter